MILNIEEYTVKNDLEYCNKNMHTVKKELNIEVHCSKSHVQSW